MVLHLPGGGSAGAFGELLSHGAGLHQLAGLQPDHVCDPAGEPAVGGDAGRSLQLVELSGTADDRAAHRRVGRSASGGDLCVDRGELRDGDRVRGGEGLARFGQGGKARVSWWTRVKGLSPLAHFGMRMGWPLLPAKRAAQLSASMTEDRGEFAGDALDTNTGTAPVATPSRHWNSSSPAESTRQPQPFELRETTPAVVSQVGSAILCRSITQHPDISTLAVWRSK